MMFDPPDYSYKDLCNTYDTDNFLLNNNSDVVNKPLDSEKNESLLTNITETQITLQSNDSGRYFDSESSTFSDSIIDQNIELYLSQPEFLLNTAPSLLDDSTINQYLLPLPDSTIDKAMDFIDISTMHACVICNEIFANEIDLMNHSISFHSSSDVLYQNESDLLSNNEVISCNEENNNNEIKFGADWLVCGICKRVLSALEGDPIDQLCCLDDNGDSNVLSQNLVTMYVCDFCNGLFANAEALNSHLIACVNENSKDLTEETVDTDVRQSSQLPEVCYSCDICGQQYSSVNELKDHSMQCPKPKTGRRFYRNINKNKMWNCGSCNQLFATARELYRHKRGEDRPEGTSQTAYTCEECDKELPSMCALHTHKKMHKVLKPGYPCGICGRRFNQSGHLAIHMRMHTGERPYPCDLCPKAFKVKVERDDHRRTHTGERPFACPLCPKTFTAAARLREHSRIHTDQRPYRCDICDAAFRRPYARTVHTLIHTGEKPHECDICGTAFRRSGDMWKHKRTIHGILPSLVDNKKIVKA